MKLRDSGSIYANHAAVREGEFVGRLLRRCRQVPMPTLSRSSSGIASCLALLVSTERRNDGPEFCRGLAELLFGFRAIDDADTCLEGETQTVLSDPSYREIGFAVPSDGLIAGETAVIASRSTFEARDGRERRDLRNATNRRRRGECGCEIYQPHTASRSGDDVRTEMREISDIKSSGLADVDSITEWHEISDDLFDDDTMFVVVLDGGVELLAALSGTGSCEWLGANDSPEVGNDELW